MLPFQAYLWPCPSHKLFCNLYSLVQRVTPQNQPRDDNQDLRCDSEQSGYFNRVRFGVRTLGQMLAPDPELIL